MKTLRIAMAFALFAGLAHGQEISTGNPLDQFKAEVSDVLAEAGVPFTEDQEKELALFIEEQRQASEDLFGVMMDFRSGPPQGAARDRALAGIQWMRDEFEKKLGDFLNDTQRAVWESFESKSETANIVQSPGVSATRPAAATAPKERKDQVQQVRINNNPFTTEDEGRAGRSGRTEIIERGGTGAFHGNFLTNFQDESLNARNPAASNKPPYYERTINGNFSGPVIRDRLTINFSVNDNRQENVGTINALTLDGPFSLGVTRPNTNRFYNGRGIYQLTTGTSVHFGVRYGTNSRQNQGIGGISLPERGSNISSHQQQYDLRQFSILSERLVYETRFSWRTDHDENNPITRAVAVNVGGDVRMGGALDHSAGDGRNIEFGNLLQFTGGKLTVRTGMDGWRRRESSLSENNFLGEFTFTDLQSYANGQPLRYRVTRGEPLLEMSQTQLGFFVQNDWRVTRRFTFMFGVRYEWQTNLDDKNNIDPRIGFAYALGGSTVIRGGAGVFHQRLNENIVSGLLRLDGKRQYEIVIDNPSYPDPFQAGTVTVKYPSSRRVRAPELAAPYNMNSSISLERSLPHNLFVSATFDYNRGVKLLRSRNLNAPLPETGLPPFADQGKIYQLESTGSSTMKDLKLSLRQRFSIFNVTGGYTLASGYSDVDAAFGLPSNNYNLRADWGRSGGVQKHQFSTSVNSRLPFDVYLTTVLSANSGSPYNITTGKDDNADGEINDRPTGLLRNSGDGPSFRNVSFNISKSFSLGGGSGPQINVFANVNNALNMTNLDTPVAVMTSRDFGRSRTARQPRDIEVGMRFQF